MDARDIRGGTSGGVSGGGSVDAGDIRGGRRGGVGGGISGGIGWGVTTGGYQVVVWMQGDAVRVGSKGMLHRNCMHALEARSPQHCG